MGDPDVCPDCGKGRYDRASGIVSAMQRCCLVYFYGPAHGEAIWREYAAMPKASLHIVRVLQSDIPTEDGNG